MSATLKPHALGLTWIEQGMIARTAHALRSEGRVWLIDPFDDQQALRAAASLGPPAGVLQLLDRHNRDCEPIATRLAVPLLRIPDRAPDTPFEVVPILSWVRWKEVALWWEQERALIVSEAVGTAPPFALGRRAGVHPLLRLTPPRSQLSPYRPEILLVGHGKAIESGAAAALDDALSHSRSDLPRLLTQLPKLVHGSWTCACG